jgi:uncharacterized protein YggE
MQATTVAAKGLAEAPYTVANFSVSLSAKGTTVPTAKARLKSQIEELNTALIDMQSKLTLEFVKNSIHTHSQVQEDWEYNKNKNEMIGYIVTYNVSFQIEELDKVNQVFDVLTSLNNVRVANPTFGLKPSQRERLSKKALKNAFAKAKERFETECTILGLSAVDFEISNWEVTYHDSQRGERVAKHMAARMTSNSYAEGAVAAAASPLGGGGMDEIDLVSGLAEVVVNLEVGYAKRGTQTVKATVVKDASSPKENLHV